MASRQSERLRQELGLNADQTSWVKQIALTQMQELPPARTQGTGSRQDMMAAMQASRAKYDGQYEEVLTSPQYTKHTDLQAQYGNRPRKGKVGKVKTAG